MLQTGEVLGSYRIVRAIGEGGMGVVYEAEHTLIARRVAIKMLSPRCSRDPDVLRRLFAEAKAVNRVRHENIVEVTDLVAQGEQSGLVMEYLTGRSLESEIQAHGSLDIDRLLSIASQIACGMAAAHDAGIVHHDLKPANIYLCEQGDRSDLVKVLDFGASNLDETADSEIEPTIIGTPLYIAPEMSTSGSSTSRGDIYSLGIILYEAATGQPPFNHARVRDLLIAHSAQKPRPPSQRRADIPPDLERLILECLEKNPYRRPASMEVVKAELDAILAQRAADRLERVRDTDLIASRTARVAPRRRLPLTAALSAAVLVALAGWAARGSAPLAGPIVPRVEHAALSRPAPQASPAVDCPEPTVVVASVPAVAAKHQRSTRVARRGTIAPQRTPRMRSRLEWLASVSARHR